MEKYIPWIVLNILIFTVYIISYYINQTSNNGIFFGVRIPKEYQNEKEIVQLDASYKKLTIIIFLSIGLISNIIFALSINLKEEILAFIMAGITILLLIIHTILFAIYYKKLKLLKYNKGWTRKSKNIVVVDTTLRKPKKDEKIKVIDSKYFLLLFIFPILMIVLTYIRYDNLPNIIVIPKTSFGEIEKETAKGIFIVYQLPIIQIFMGTLFYFINKVIMNSKVDLNSGSIKEAVERKKKFKRLGSILMLVTGIQIIILFSVLQLSIIFGFDSSFIEIIFLLIILVTMIIFIFSFIKAGQGGRNLSSSEELDELYKDDDDKWILGCLYYNKNDPSVMIEKRVGIGWTINLGNPKGMAILVITLLLIFIMILFGILTS
ncbi:DUF5808 domain-containing protein [Clostridium chauvoei]|uniref:DUF5808 domain-containing protein n=4 Tax=Clostridium chauvoei TaxID=46867 RepID=A0ABD4RFK3_9CLOT|nr:DUF5808 domain-containing protein [Clostridium chauvoei]ATD55674.1 hypothetical protein BTM20_10675 [Clostridium chauvoei]ATD56649.1 hypothetical protein BTM21_02345 [Clostridium chauvoei]MBX7280086.1 hypothetical protein [Clostridium chauvoei]MBX7282570.1 hypothetical protein [Clostridium chauvoei]MBX7284977.1 hypothetical protein [Clostridium chauvoei]